MKIKYEPILGILVTLFIIGMFLLALKRNDRDIMSNKTSVKETYKNSNSKRKNEINDANLKPVINSKSKTTKKISSEDYSIIKIETVHNIKASIDVRLKRELLKSEIEQLAYDLKTNQNQEFERIFISYYMPGMKVGSGAWATSHFDPELEIFMTSNYYDDTKIEKVVSLSKTDIAINKFKDKNSSAKIIGKWYQGNNYMTVFYQMKGKLYLIEINLNTPLIKEPSELITEKRSGMDVYIIKEFLYPTKKEGLTLIGDYTDYYKIEQNGDLSLYDKVGLMERYKKLD